MIHFINITENKFRNKRLYRFTTIHRIKQSLIDGVIRLSKPEKWNDPYEKYFINGKYTFNDRKLNLPIKGKIFCLCLSERYNSEAYWKTYSPNEDGIKLSVNTSILVDKLQKIRNVNFYIGKIEYRNSYDFRDVFNKSKKYELIINKALLRKEIENTQIGLEQIKLMLFKRKAFLYEEEFRIFAVPEVGKFDNYELKVKLPEIVTKFYLDPRISDSDYNIFRDEFINYYKIKPTQVGRSVLYKKLKMKKFAI